MSFITNFISKALPHGSSGKHFVGYEIHRKSQPNFPITVINYYDNHDEYVSQTCFIIEKIHEMNDLLNSAVKNKEVFIALNEYVLETADVSKINIISDYTKS
jgi:hypothetical protein